MAAAVLACVACGGGDPVSLNAVIAGERMVGQDAVSNVIVQGRQTKTMAYIYIADFPKLCDLLNAGQERKNSKGLVLALATLAGKDASAPSTIGDYTIQPPAAPDVSAGNVAYAFYWENDASCQTATKMEAFSGTVTLTGIDGIRYSGTFDLTFTGSNVKGTFNTGGCGALDTQVEIGTCI